MEFIYQRVFRINRAARNIHIRSGLLVGLAVPNEAGTILRIDALEVLYLVVADKEITGLWQGLHLVDWHDAVVQIEVDREG